MPTVLRVGSLRFFFYSADGVEPPHVHAEQGDAHAKVWLDPVRVASSNGFRPNELRRVEAIVEGEVNSLKRAWDEFFGH
jgi:hypothetical protein